MNVELRFVCPEVVGGAKDGCYTLSENISVREALCELQRHCSEFCEGYEDYIIVLVNGAAASLDTVLSEGFKLTVLRKAYGG